MQGGDTTGLSNNQKRRETILWLKKKEGKELSNEYHDISFPENIALRLFELSLDFFYIVKVTKSSHHLSHDRASKGHGPIPCLMS